MSIGLGMAISGIASLIAVIYLARALNNARDVHATNANGNGAADAIMIAHLWIMMVIAHHVNLGIINMIKVTKCTGEGQGSCKRCEDNGKWNRSWMSLLSRIEGLPGCYCSDCVEQIKREMESQDPPRDIIGEMF